MEIAEILDSQAGDKYTVMLVRNTEDVDNASFVHVQMLNEDGRESVRYVCVVCVGGGVDVGGCWCVCVSVCGGWGSKWYVCVCVLVERERG